MTQTDHELTLTDNDIQTMMAHGCTVMELKNGKTVLLRQGRNDE